MLGKCLCNGHDGHVMILFSIFGGMMVKGVEVHKYGIEFCFELKLGIRMLTKNECLVKV